MKITKKQLTQIIKEEIDQIDEIFGLTTTKSAEHGAEMLRNTYEQELRNAEAAIDEIITLVKPHIDPGLQSQVSQIKHQYEENRKVDLGRQERIRPRLK